MRLPRALLAFTVVLGISALGGASRADIPGPRSECEVEGLGCEACWQSYGSGPDDQAVFEKCQEPLLARGLKEACRHRQGAGDAVFFCPAGTNPGKVTTGGGGCAGCSVGEGGLSGALAATALGLLLAAVRRRRYF